MTALPDAYLADKHTIAFPTLEEAQLKAVAAVGRCRACGDGDILFSAGDRNFCFYVVTQGKLAIVAPAPGNTSKPDASITSGSTSGDASGGADELLIAEHLPGQFSGDVAMINGSASPVSARCVGDTKVIEVHCDDLRKLIAEHAELGELILRAFLMRRAMISQRGYKGAQLIGSRWSRETFRLRDFLARQQALFTWTDPDEDADTEAILRGFHVGPHELPVVICPDGTLLRNPGIQRLADCLGLRNKIDEKVYDLAVVGAGPGGLAAAVYGASEGLATVVIEGVAPGGQAGTSSKIENYLGFPTGVSGADLTRRATLQAQKFGATLSSPRTVVGIDCEHAYKRLRLDDDSHVFARSIVIATGAAYRKLDAADYARFEGNGIYYGATHTEASYCKDRPIVVVGGGNSAGQAAVFLAGHARKLYLLFRRNSLADTMSRYLIDRIERTENIQLLPQTNITAFTGEDTLQAIRVRRQDGNTQTLECSAVFVMIGADPCTDWLDGCCALCPKGFVATGEYARKHPQRREHWPADLKREPFYLETTRPGVFAVGDVRAGSVKRVASAVGEGSMCVKYVHEWLAG